MELVNADTLEATVSAQVKFKFLPENTIALHSSVAGSLS